MIGPRGLRCSPCGHVWPFSPSYDTCPDCGRETWETTGDQPMTTYAASELVKEIRAREARHRAFEEHCAELDRRRAQLLHDPETAIADVIAQAEALLSTS